MKMALLVFAFGTYVGVASSAHLVIRADVLDYKAPRSPIRTFDAESLTIAELHRKAGLLQSHQIVAISCIGPGMGTDGIAVLNVITNNQLDESLMRLNAKPATTLVQLCGLELIEVQVDVKDFKAPRGSIRSFDGSLLTIAELQNKTGNLRGDKVVTIWCIERASGVFALDVLRHDRLNTRRVRLGADPTTTLVELCRIRSTPA
jgi:hypothetical protein